MNLKVNIVEADLTLADYQRDILAMTSAFALDPMEKPAQISDPGAEQYGVRD